MDVANTKQRNVAKGKQRGKAKKKPKLTLTQRRFCELYATDKEFFGNGVQSYIEAFSTKTKKIRYNTARTQASKLLTNPNILAHINKLLEATLNDAHVDKQLALLITQNADFSSKIAAIREYNALKRRIVKKMEHNLSPELSTVLEAINNGTKGVLPRDDPKDSSRAS